MSDKPFHEDPRAMVLEYGRALTMLKSVDITIREHNRYNDQKQYIETTMESFYVRVSKGELL